MRIERVNSQEQFYALCSWSQMTQFGSFGNLSRTSSDDSDDDSIFVAVARDNDGVVVGYVNSDRSGIWNIEVQPEARGHGVARELVKASGAKFFCEVCSDDGAALAESLGFDYEDCR